MTSVALSGHVHLFVLQCCELSFQASEKLEELGGSFLHSREERLTVGETSAHRLVNVNHSCWLFDPGVLGCIHRKLTRHRVLSDPER